MAKMNVVPLNRHYPFVGPAPEGMMETKPVTYQLLEDSPDKIENCIKRYPRIEPNVTRVLSLSNVNNE
jgi:hypothetical protein